MMGVWDVIKGVGTAALSVVCPAAIPLIAIANKYLPEEAQLDVNTATGEQLMSARESLPPAARVEIDHIAASVTIAKEEGWTERYKAQCVADGQSTRPKIAYLMAWMLAIPYVLIGLAMGWAIYSKQVDLADMWPTLLAYLSVPMGILNKYFGELRKEQSNRLEVKPASLLGSIGKMFGK